MQELLRSNDPVRLSWIDALLSDQRLDCIVLDTHTAILEGSAGAIVRRLMVPDEQFERAVEILRDAGELPADDQR